MDQDLLDALRSFTHLIEEANWELGTIRQQQILEMCQEELEENEDD